MNAPDTVNVIAGRRLPDCSIEAIDEGVIDVLDRYATAVEAADQIVVLPDVQYPYHPTTGLVTNPDVVEALVRLLVRDRDPRDVVVGCGTSATIRTSRVAQLLGYDDLCSRLGIELVDLDAAERTRRTVGVRGKKQRVAIPRPLDGATVVNVPTLRRSDWMEMAAGMTNLASAIYDHRPAAYDALAAVEACPAVVTLLDATYSYAGAPSASRFLLASDDVRALDSVAADVLGIDTDDVPYLSLSAAPERALVVDGVRLRTLASSLPDVDPPAEVGGSDLMKSGYRLYARLSGDAVPPQFVEGSSD